MLRSPRPSRNSLPESPRKLARLRANKAGPPAFVSFLSISIRAQLVASDESGRSQNSSAFERESRGGDKDALFFLDSQSISTSLLSLPNPHPPPFLAARARARARIRKMSRLGRRLASFPRFDQNRGADAPFFFSFCRKSCVRSPFSGEPVSKSSNTRVSPCWPRPSPLRPPPPRRRVSFFRFSFFGGRVRPSADRAR